MGLFVGVSTLPRKWLAKKTKMAVVAEMAKTTQKAWFSIISDFCKGHSKKEREPHGR